MTHLSSRPPLPLDTLPPPGATHGGGRLLLLQTSFYRERVLFSALASPELELIVADPAADLTLLFEQTLPDVLLVDRSVTDYDVLCRTLKTGPWRNVPIVVLDWDDGGETAAVEALESGADEFAVAPARLLELRARVHNQLRHKQRLDILKRLRAERDSLRDDSRLDTLTSVLNRKALDRTLVELEDDDSELSVVFIDVDHFKTLNDTFGHSAGDRALATLGRLLAEHLRPNDVVGRYGGEEFLVVLRNADGEVARRVAERIRQSIADTEIPGLARSVTVSAGVACRARGERLELLVARADAALYSAKRDGRDRVLTAPPAADPSAATAALELEPFTSGVRGRDALPSGACAAE